MGDLQAATATGRYITGYHPDTPEAGGRRATRRGWIPYAIH
jgi:hypothetical protein